MKVIIKKVIVNNHPPKHINLNIDSLSKVDDIKKNIDESLREAIKNLEDQP